jgi:hypothetical protein
MVAGTSRIVRRTFHKVPDNFPSGPRTVKVGFLAGSANLDKAIWNEFGTKGGGWGGPIPERPFMRNAARDNASKYLKISASQVVAILTGKVSLRGFLDKLGIVAKGDIQANIGSTGPQNSPVTIALKGSSKPLIDTGEMRQGVQHKVGN